MRKIVVICLFLGFGSVFAQKHEILLDYTILDTIKIEKGSISLGILWLNDTIVVKKQKSSEKEESTENGYKDGISFKEGKVIIDFRQNCFSYALEKYFEQDSIYNQNLFGSEVSMEDKSFGTFLKKHCRKIKAFPTKPKKNLSIEIPSHSIVVLWRDWGHPMHGMYYKDGVFYTKNGGFPKTTFQNLRKFLKKKYWDTAKIEIYQFRGVD